MKLRQFVRNDKITITDRKGNPRVVIGKLDGNDKPRTVADKKS